MIPVIIVGRGLAANVLAHTFHRNSTAFKMIGLPGLSNSSLVAAGIYNPVVFRRMNKSWMASSCISALNEFFGHCEKLLGVRLIHPRSIIRSFNEEQEKKLWLKKSELELDEFLDDKIYSYPIENIKCGPEFGKVKQSGNIDLEVFLEASSDFFSESIIEEKFNHDDLQVSPEKIIYKNIEAANIVFCEGYLIKNNPWFNWIPLSPAKGETFIIKCKLGLDDSIFNKDGFIMRIGEDLFKVGATYNWEDLNDEPSAAGREELESRLKKMIGCDYAIVEHKAGVRPATDDRRPIIGPHPQHRNLHVFNGLGAKGVMLAPYIANNFVNFMLHSSRLNGEISVERFYSLHRA
jgi:hypothetical protein